jgi:hypothetical protein
VRRQAGAHGVERRRADAHVLGEAADPDPADTFPPQVGREAGLVEGRELVAIVADALADEADRGWEAQVGVEGGTRRVLHAMRRPRAAPLAEARMPGGVPVARGVDRDAGPLGLLDPAVQHRHHGVALGDGERAAGTEVALHVDHDQRVALLESRWHASPTEDARGRAAVNAPARRAGARGDRRTGRFPHARPSSTGAGLAGPATTPARARLTGGGAVP